MFKIFVNPLSFLLFLLVVVTTDCNAQSDLKELFIFSKCWMKTPYNETSYKFNRISDSQVDQKDLLILLSQWQNEGVLEEMTINLPDLSPEVKPLVLVRIPAGSYSMGRSTNDQDNYSDEEPQHWVTLSDDFYIGKYEVTKAQWVAVMHTTPWSGEEHVSDDPDSPAVYVSYEDIIGPNGFVEKLNTLTQGMYTLPTEGQWEYACRAGTTTRFYWGEEPNYSSIGDYSWYYGNTEEIGESYAHPVGQKIPNAWNLYDLSGNVWEWCLDWYDSYPSDPQQDPEGPLSGTYRVLRGGSWDYGANYCRSSNRFRNYPDVRYYNFGFRLVKRL